MKMIDITDIEISGSVNTTTSKTTKEELDDFIQSIIDEQLGVDDETLQKKIVYSDLLTSYLARFGRTTEDDFSDLVLSEFQISDDFDKKIQILQDAIDNSIRIEESTYYPEIQERYVEDDGHFFR